jgi:hypothetical protein
MCPFARYLVLLVSAGIIVAAALGLAGAADAAMPGHIWQHGVWHLGDLQANYTR